MFTSRRISTLGGSTFSDNWSFEMNSTDSNDYMNTGATYQDVLRDNLSVSCCLKSEDIQVAGLNVICGIKKDANDWFYLGIGNLGKMSYYHIAGGNTNNRNSGTAIADGPSDWLHCVWTLKKNTASTGANFYVNGDLLGSAATNGINDDQWAAFDCNSLDFFVGSQNNAGGGGSNTFDGKFSEWAIYDKELSAAEVKLIYNNREPFNHMEWSGTANCKGWYRFGDGNERGSGTTIYDMSGNGNNGTLIASEEGDLQGDTP